MYFGSSGWRGVFCTKGTWRSYYVSTTISQWGERWSSRTSQAHGKVSKSVCTHLKLYMRLEAFIKRMHVCWLHIQNCYLFLYVAMVHSIFPFLKLLAGYTSLHVRNKLLLSPSPTHPALPKNTKMKEIHNTPGAVTFFFIVLLSTSPLCCPW